MPHPGPPRRDETLLIVVDVQERLLGAMPAGEVPALLRQVGILIDAARVLGLPVLLTEQYTRGLGPTAEALLARVQASERLEKLEFSVYQNEAARQRIHQHAPKTAIVCGVEAHVCVYQTARDLAGAGLRVIVPEDAVLSRHEKNRRAGLHLIEAAGGLCSSVEAVLFDLVGRASDPCFKEISKLVK